MKTLNETSTLNISTNLKTLRLVNNFDRRMHIHKERATTFHALGYFVEALDITFDTLIKTFNALEYFEVQLTLTFDALTITFNVLSNFDDALSLIFDARTTTFVALSNPHDKE